MKKILFFKTLAFLLILGNTYCYAQSVGVSGIGSVPDASALLDVDATGMSPQKGILIPRVALTSSTDAATIATPATSLMIYNTATAGTAPNDVVPGYYYNSGTSVSPVWVKLLTGGSPGSGWQTNGNTGTTAANFVGTTDATSLRFRSGNTQFMIIDSIGNIGIGTAAPDASARLDVTAIDRGMLVPRIALQSTTDVTTIASPATSLLVYNTSTLNDVSPGFYYWNGAQWVNMIGRNSGGTHYVGELFGGGVVFYTYGDAVGNQFALIASLKDNSTTQIWSNTTATVVPPGGSCGSAAVSTINGLCNSYAIQAQDANSAANTCLTYTSTFNTPPCSNCTPWYLPAQDEMSQLFNSYSSVAGNNNLAFFIAKNNVTGGTPAPLSSALVNYWTSTERDNQNAYYLSASTGSIGNGKKNNGPYYTRCIRAITGSPPAAAGTITGTTPVCQGTVMTYTIPAISGATGYVWAFSGTGYSFVGSTNTNTIKISFSGSATGGNLTVYGTNVAGNGTISPNYAITVNAWSCGACPITDSRDNQNYNTVVIGSQCWMAQNLNYGTYIDKNTAQSNNGIVEKWCIINSGGGGHPSINYCDSYYGGWYQWAEMVQYINGGTNSNNWSPAPAGNIQGICPTAWHIPRDAEWCTMENTIEAGTDAGCNINNWRGTNIGGMLKKTGSGGQTPNWSGPNTGATNSSGFTAVPGGYITSGGAYNNERNNEYWWAAEQSSNSRGIYRMVEYDRADEERNTNPNKPYAYHVRCVKD